MSCDHTWPVKPAFLSLVTSAKESACHEGMANCQASTLLYDKASGLLKA